MAGLRFASWEGKYRRAKESVSLTPLDLIFEFRELSTSLIGSVTYRTSTVDAVVVSKFISWFGERVGVLLRRADRSLKSIFD